MYILNLKYFHKNSLVQFLFRALKYKHTYIDVMYLGKISVYSERDPVGEKLRNQVCKYAHTFKYAVLEHFATVIR